MHSTRQWQHLNELVCNYQMFLAPKCQNLNREKEGNVLREIIEEGVGSSGVSQIFISFSKLQIFENCWKIKNVPKLSIPAMVGCQTTQTTPTRPTSRCTCFNLILYPQKKRSNGSSRFYLSIIIFFLLLWLSISSLHSLFSAAISYFTHRATYFLTWLRLPHNSIFHVFVWYQAAHSAEVVSCLIHYLSEVVF